MRIHQHMSSAELREEIESLRRAGTRITSSKESARAFLLENGFIDEDGNSLYGQEKKDITGTEDRGQT